MYLYILVHEVYIEVTDRETIFKAQWKTLNLYRPK